jgi:hypothetical protein
MCIMKGPALVGLQAKLLGKFLRGLERQPRVSEIAQGRFIAGSGFRHGNERAGHLELRPKKTHRKVTRFSDDL